MSILTRVMIWAVLFSAVGCRTGIGQEQVKEKAKRKENPHQLQLQTHKVIVFKDGYALIVKHATAVTDENGDVFTHEAPDAAVLGSFWSVAEKGEMLSLKSGWETIESRKNVQLPCASHLEVLEANVGKRVRVVRSSGLTHEGVIDRVLMRPMAEQPLRLPPNDPFLHLFSARSDLLSPPTIPSPINIINQQGQFFILRSNEQDVLLPISDIRTLTIDKMNTTVAREVRRSERVKRITFRFAEPNQPCELTIMYFRPGVRWIPTYRIDLHEKEARKGTAKGTAKGGAKGGAKTANIRLQAEILNEAEDFDAPVDVVVGSPNFRFRNTPSPLVLENTMRNALAQAEPQLMGQLRMGNNLFNAQFQQRSGESSRPIPNREANAPAAQVVLPAELSAGGVQELFVYHLARLHLKKGERASLPLFAAEASYRNVYTWEVHVQRNAFTNTPAGAAVRSPLRLSTNQVWRQIELANRTPFPWTTGPVMIMQDGLPLAQELLTYTSAGEGVRVPLTIAVDLKGSFAEEEVRRQSNKLHWNGDQYARIDQLAKVVLRNNKNEDVDVEITLRMGGKIDAAEPEGKTRVSGYLADDWRNYRGDGAVNNSSRVLWKTQIKARETAKFRAEYHYFLRQ